MRRAGESIVVIAKKLGVSKSSASIWCQDITLTAVQIKRLLERKENGLKLGQLRGAHMKKMNRLKKESLHRHEGMKRFQKLPKDEFFIAGVALYLAEGAKTKRRVHFVNSDPRLIRFMLDWLHEFFGIDRTGVAPSLLINEVHRSREDRILRFWSNYLAIPRNFFRKTAFVHTKQKKIYENHSRYNGTMRFQVLKGTELWYKISGLMEGLLQHIPKPV